MQQLKYSSTTVICWMADLAIHEAIHLQARMHDVKWYQHVLMLSNVFIFLTLSRHFLLQLHKTCPADSKYQVKHILKLVAGNEYGIQTRR